MDMNGYIFDNLKENSRISKEALNKLITGSSKEIAPTQKIKTIIKCDNCPYKGLPKEQFEDNCNDFCVFRSVSEVLEKQELSEMTKTIVNPISENKILVKMPYVVYNGKNIFLSKTAIKQYLLYNFFNTNKFNVIKNISLKYLSNLLKVSTSTIKRNNEILQELNLIHATYTGLNMYDISIIGKSTMHVSEKEGGKGYLTLSKESLFHFFNIANVNLLRIELKKILISDYSTSIYKNKKIADITISSFKNVLPFYLRKGKQAIKQILIKKESLFKVSNIDFKRNLFELNVSTYETKEKLRIRLEEKISNDLVLFLKSINFNLVSEKETIIETSFQTTESMIIKFETETTECNKKKSDKFTERLNDLVRLSIEYGAQTIKHTLIHINKRYLLNEGISITNIGGFIRNFFNNYININGSCLYI